MVVVGVFKVNVADGGAWGAVFAVFVDCGVVEEEVGCGGVCFDKGVWRDGV